ncbi:MAG: sensor histidine kinase [Anaerolineae bacterium]
MREILRTFFTTNEVIMYSVYGQVFFVLGLAIALQSRRYSRLALARSLPWLAAFGLLHGLHEWGFVFIPIQATYLPEPFIRLLQAGQVVLLSLSFATLFQFGVASLRPLSGRWRSLYALPVVLLLGWTLVTFSLGLYLSTDLTRWHQSAAALARYFLGLPGGLVAAYALRRQALRHIVPLGLPHIVRTLRLAGLSLVAYALLSGLVVPPAPFWPADRFNEDLFFAWTTTPVILWRSLTGLIMIIAMLRVLEVFEVEVDRRIEDMEQAQILAAERQRISRELHDGALQAVYAAGLLTESLRNRLPAEDPLRTPLDRALTAIQNAIADLRRYIADLGIDPTSADLAEALRQVATDASLRTLVNMDLELDLGPDAHMAPGRAGHVIAIVHEALSNVARHARAQRAVVRATRHNEHLRVEVVDDGVGFSRDAETGFGLRNMRDRARLLGGRLQIESPGGRGTRVVLEIPWEELK